MKNWNEFPFLRLRMLSIPWGFTGLVREVLVCPGPAREKTHSDPGLFGGVTGFFVFSH